MAKTLTDQRVVIIGGSSGIGRATAQLCAAEGAQVVIAGRSRAKLAEAREVIGESVEAHPLDFTRERQVRRFFSKVGRFDHLVVTAAQGATGRFLEMDMRAARNLFESKFWGQVFAVRHGAPQMSETGSITLFSSLASRRAFEQLTVMGAANAAVESLCRGLALELAPRRVNAVCPGAIDTPAHDWMGDEQRSAWYADMAKALPVGHVGRPEDVAQAVLYLMRTEYVTGTVLVIDGGHTLR